MTECHLPPTPAAINRLNGTLADAKSMLVDLRHFAANPDTPLQLAPGAYLHWLRSQGTSRAVARWVAPIWCPEGTSALAEEIFPSEAPDSPESQELQVHPAIRVLAKDEPKSRPVRDFWNEIDPELLESIRASIENMAPLRIQVSTSLDQDLFLKVRRQRGGATAFISSALEEYLDDPEAVFAASGRLAERRKNSPSKPTVTSKVPPELADRISAVLEAFRGKVARVTLSTLVGGCALLRAEKLGIADPSNGSSDQ